MSRARWRRIWSSSKVSIKEAQKWWQRRVKFQPIGRVSWWLIQNLSHLWDLSFIYSDEGKYWHSNTIKHNKLLWLHTSILTPDQWTQILTWYSLFWYVKSFDTKYAACKLLYLHPMIDRCYSVNKSIKSTLFCHRRPFKPKEKKTKPETVFVSLIINRHSSSTGARSCVHNE